MSIYSRFRLLGLPFFLATLGTLVFTSCSSEYGPHLTIPTTGYSKIAFSQDHTKLATTTPDNTIQILDARTGDVLQELNGIHKQSINALVFSKDGNTLVSTADDNKAVIWNLQTDKNLELVHGMYDIGIVNDAVFSPDEKLLATYQGSVGVIYIWDAKNGQLLPKRHYARSKPIFSADGKSILFVDRGDSKNHQPLYNEVTLWNLSTDEETNFPKKASTPMDSLYYGKYPLTVPTFSNDSSKIYIIEQGPTVKLQTWDVLTQRLDSSIDLAPKAVPGIVFRWEFSDDRTRLLLNWSGTNGAGVVKKIASVWDLKTGTEISTMNYLSLYSEAHFLNPSGSIIYTYTIDPKSPFAERVKLWNAAKGESFLELFGVEYKDKMQRRSGNAFAVHRSPDGTQLAVDNGNGILLFDLDQVSP